MRKIAALLIVLAAMSSCKVISSVIHDDQVVARVGDHKLYRSQLREMLPEFLTPEDSVAMSLQYINTWASDLLYLKVAQEQLSKEEMDVTAELEDYQRSLIKYRYEQRYLNERLDTLVTDNQIQQYYESHLESFELERPILKVRFVDIMKDAPGKDAILKAIAGHGASENIDSLAVSSALRYFDYSHQWMDALVLAREFGVDYKSMLAELKGDTITISPQDRGDMMVAYVCDIILSGTAPVEYCEDRIKDYILSARKHAILESLEQDLLTSALDRNDFVVY